MSTLNVDAKHIPRSSSPFPNTPVTDKKGNEIKTVGYKRFGFDSEVPIDILRSLYLRPHYVATVSGDQEDSQVAQFVTGQFAEYQSKSIYHPQTQSISYTTLSRFPPVKLLPNSEKKRILVTGGAGFVGSHLVDRLMLLGHDVTVLDNFFTGSKTTVSHWVGHPNFEMVRHDVIEPFMIELEIYHLACPASPPHYQFNAVKTIKTSFMGTLNMLGLAKRTKARFLITSTSAKSSMCPYLHLKFLHTANTCGNSWGHVNPIGPRACYDEGKRVAETLTYGFHRQDGVDVRVARIFNTFGPRMNVFLPPQPYDGRVVSNFIIQALKGEDMTVYGDGQQTRSFQYIHDLVDGLISLMNSDETRPVNIGNQDEFTILKFAEHVRDIVEKVQKEDGTPLKPKNGTDRVNIIHGPMPTDDPQKRRPDTTRAKEVLQWEPKWTVEMGVEEMVRDDQLSLLLGPIGTVTRACIFVSCTLIRHSGVGFGVCHRLLVQLSQKSPPDASPEAQKHPIASPDDEISPFVPADGLTLILACRSAQRAETARTNLYKLIDKEIAKNCQARFVKRGECIRVRCGRKKEASCELPLPHKVNNLELSPRFPYITHLILNAGVGDFVGINWPLAIWEVCTRFKTAVTAPGFKIQGTGKMSDDGLGWVWQCNVFGHFVLARALREMLAHNPFSSSRVLWTTSLEGRPSFFPGIDDYQLVSASHSYEASKYESELVACALDELESERNNGVRHLAVHPGVFSIRFHFAARSNSGVGQARLFGSKHHPIQTYKAAISVVHVALVSLAILPSLTTFGATNEKSGQPPEGVSGGNEKRSRAEDYSPVRYGAETNIFGTEYVGVQPVEGYEEHREVGRELVARCNRLYNAFEKKFKM
ncbi:UDP-xylose synthase [Rhizoctonia solani AG-1 IA]|uniref:UDP-glucuronic acid decarboxylase 1 n=1 Tax=Thanatephorus cucumeris (strain AG1-IA) TaxID=983506 RepID=L8X921_THACA|nr:UDP-xylose synthase [Rhizoctonia solani AG-1 IA]